LDCLEQSQESQVTILSATDLSVLLMTDLRVRPSKFGHIRDDAYMLPSPDWFTDTFPDTLRRFQFHVGQRNAADECNDCDDYARGAAFCAQLNHASTEGRKTKTALAVGEFSYDDATLGRHAITFAVVRHAAAYRLLFLEPQTCKPIELSRAEIESCAYYIV
jgi:hypothetical protein